MATTTVGGELGGPPSSPPVTARSLRSSNKRVGEKVIRAVLAGAAGLSVLTTFGIVISLLVPAAGSSHRSTSRTSCSAPDGRPRSSPQHSAWCR